MENFATVLKYTWSLISEYKGFRDNGTAEEKAAATLMLSALVKYLNDYITPPVA